MRRRRSGGAVVARVRRTRGMRAVRRHAAAVQVSTFGRCRTQRCPVRTPGCPVRAQRGGHCSAVSAVERLAVRISSSILKAGPAGGLRPPSGPATTRRPPGNRPHRSRTVRSWLGVALTTALAQRLALPGRPGSWSVAFRLLERAGPTRLTNRSSHQGDAAASPSRSDLTRRPERAASGPCGATEGDDHEQHHGHDGHQEPG
jgi:hypothetical protein